MPDGLLTGAASDAPIDWQHALAQLNSAGDDGVDDLIDDLTAVLFSTGPQAEAMPFLLVALRRARSELSLRSAALALAITASPGEDEAVDALTDAYRKWTDHPVLAVDLLEALSILAMANPVARAHVSALLLRLQPSDNGHILIGAARVIGRLDDARPDPDLREQLDRLARTADSLAQAELRHQWALTLLRDALGSTDRNSLVEQLVAASAAFARAEASEEHRPDASMFRRLLAIMLAFFDVNDVQGNVAVRLVELAKELDRGLNDLVLHDWHGYRSDHATQLGIRALRIGDALRAAVNSASEAEEWTNFAAALEGLAELYTLVRAGSHGSEGHLSSGLSKTADTVFAAALGPLLRRAVGQRRLARIVRDHLPSEGNDDVLRGLRALEQASATSGFADDRAIPDHLLSPIARLADRAGQSTDAFLADFVEAAEQGEVDQWAARTGLISRRLPVEQLALYGGTPAIDEVVRPLLHDVAAMLGDYSTAKWGRLVEVLVHMVQFAELVRDTMPPYLVCAEDGGLGQTASERDLQDDLFEWLRKSFGRRAVYERSKTAGGRVDTGVVFDEAEFPIEVKHEFATIDPDHVRSSYLAQSDAYATSTDRFGFLTLLDLRDGNAAGHRLRTATARRNRRENVPTALYHLRDSFRVECLPSDPDIPNSTYKIIVVGIIPGNRPLPSGMSHYSTRPKSARRSRKATKQA